MAGIFVGAGIAAVGVALTYFGQGALGLVLVAVGIAVAGVAWGINDAGGNPFK